LELPHAVDGAGERFRREGIADRCVAVSGDFVEDVPTSGDAYMMKKVIHDWDDERGYFIGNSQAMMKYGSKYGGPNQTGARNSWHFATKFHRDESNSVAPAVGRWAHVSASVTDTRSQY
jgi:O-methyltransferase domain